MNHYVIVADGDFLPKTIIEEVVRDKIIIALDAAANRLAHLDIMPQLILGDFDTLNDASLAHWGIKKDPDETPYLGSHGVTIVPRQNQAITDLMKAIEYCDENHASTITLICATGGRLDHHEANLRVLRTAYRKDRLILLHTEQQTLRFVKDETVSFTGEIGDKCGVLAFPAGAFSSQGLVYEVNDYPLQFGFSESIGNIMKTKQATITVKGEALLVMPLQLISL